MVYCTLPPGRVGRAVKHRRVEEVWLCVAGAGELWRRDVATTRQEIVALSAGVAASIPVGTEFQFRQMGARPLEVVITTLPPWPGPEEAIPVAGAWEPSPR
jgi:mannose-6-phosphate isomerase-like protein (cupin superfamily)